MDYVEHPAKVLATYLRGQNVAVWNDQTSNTITWTITYDWLPEEGDKASRREWLTVVDALAIQQGRKMRGERTEYYELQVHLRAKNDDNAKIKGKTICDLFDGLYQETVTVDDTAFLVNHVQRQGGVQFLKAEEKALMRRHIINVRARITRG